MKTIKYYGAKADILLPDACEKIGSALQMSKFTFDAEDTWEYAYASNEKYSLNITKTDDFDTICTWMDDAPTNINYQIILKTQCAESDELLQNINEKIFNVFGVSLVLYSKELCDD